MQAFLLTRDALRELHARFDALATSSAGLTKLQFVQVMLSALDELRRERGDLAVVQELVARYAAIDVDGDGSVSWPEFMAHVVESGLGSPDASPVPVHKYALAPGYVDTTTRSPVNRISWLPQPLDAMAVIEDSCTSLKLYAPRSMRLMAALPAITASQLEEIESADGVVRSAASSGSSSSSSSSSSLLGGGGAGAAGAAGSSASDSTRARIPIPGAVIAAIRRERAGLQKEIVPFVNACELLPELGILAVAQSNGIIALWSSPALLAHAQALEDAREAASSAAESSAAAAAAARLTSEAQAQQSSTASQSMSGTAAASSARGSSSTAAGEASAPQRRLGPAAVRARIRQAAVAAGSGSLPRIGGGFTVVGGLRAATPASHLAWASAGGCTALFAASSHGDCAVISVWDVQDAACLARFRAHSDAICAMVAVPAHGVLVSASIDGTVLVHRLRDWAAEVAEASAAGASAAGTSAAAARGAAAAEATSRALSPLRKTGGSGAGGGDGDRDSAARREEAVLGRAFALVAARSGTLRGVDEGGVPGANPLPRAFMNMYGQEASSAGIQSTADGDRAGAEAAGRASGDPERQGSDDACGLDESDDGGSSSRGGLTGATSTTGSLPASAIGSASAYGSAVGPQSSAASSGGTSRGGRLNGRLGEPGERHAHFAEPQASDRSGSTAAVSVQKQKRRAAGGAAAASSMGSGSATSSSSLRSSAAGTGANAGAAAAAIGNGSGSSASALNLAHVLTAEAAGFPPVGRLGGNALAVTSLVYVAGCDMLLTAGFDRDALAFDLATLQPVLRLRGHRCPLIGIAEVPAPVAPGAAAAAASGLPPSPSSHAASSSPAGNRSGGAGSAPASGGQRQRRFSGEGSGSRALTLDCAQVAKLWSLDPTFDGHGVCLQTIDLTILAAGPTRSAASMGISSTTAFAAASGAAAPGGAALTGAARLGAAASAATATAALSAAAAAGPPSLKALVKASASAAAAAASVVDIISSGRTLPRAMAVAGSTGEFIVGAARLTLLQPRAPGDDVAGTRRLTAALYNPLRRTFLIAVDRTVRVFDSTGAPAGHWVNVAPAAISAMTLDARKRKLVLGTQSGVVLAVNAASGGLLKLADRRHDSEVTAARYIPGVRQLVTASWDQSLLLHDDSTAAALTGIKQVAGAHASDITALSVSPPAEVGLVATGGADGTVRLHDIATARLEGLLQGHAGEVSCVEYIEGHPLLVSADTAGSIIMWATRPCLPAIVNKPVLALKHLEVQHDARGERMRRHAVPASASKSQTQPASLLEATSMERTLAFGPPITALTHGTVMWRGAPPAQVGVTSSADGTVVAAVPPLPVAQQRRCVLVHGDESGRVKVWDLSTALDLTAVPPLREMSRLAAMRHREAAKPRSKSEDGHPSEGSAAGMGTAAAAAGTSSLGELTSRLVGLPTTRAELLATVPTEILQMAKAMAHRRRSLQIAGRAPLSPGSVIIAGGVAPALPAIDSPLARARETASLTARSASVGPTATARSSPRDGDTEWDAPPSGRLQHSGRGGDGGARGAAARQRRVSSAGARASRASRSSLTGSAVASRPRLVAFGPQTRTAGAGGDAVGDAGARKTKSSSVDNLFGVAPHMRHGSSSGNGSGSGLGAPSNAGRTEPRQRSATAQGRTRRSSSGRRGSLSRPASGRPASAGAAGSSRRPHSRGSVAAGASRDDEGDGNGAATPSSHGGASNASGAGVWRQRSRRASVTASLDLDPDVEAAVAARARSASKPGNAGLLTQAMRARRQRHAEIVAARQPRRVSSDANGDLELRAMLLQGESTAADGGNEGRRRRASSAFERVEEDGAPSSHSHSHSHSASRPVVGSSRSVSAAAAHGGAAAVASYGDPRYQPLHPSNTRRGSLTVADMEAALTAGAKGGVGHGGSSSGNIRIGTAGPAVPPRLMIDVAATRRSASAAPDSPSHGHRRGGGARSPTPPMPASAAAAAKGNAANAVTASVVAAAAAASAPALVSKRRRRNSVPTVAAVARAMVASVDATPVVPILLQFQAHDDAIKSVQLIADHEPPALLTAAADGSVRLWALHSGEPLGNFIPDEILQPLSGGIGASSSAGAGTGAGDAAAGASGAVSGAGAGAGALAGPEAKAQVKLAWRFHMDDSAQRAAIEAEAKALLTKVQAAEADAAIRTMARAERQAKLQQEMAAAGRSLTMTSPSGGSTVMGGGGGYGRQPRPSSAFGKTHHGGGSTGDASVNRDRAGTMTVGTASVSLELALATAEAEATAQRMAASVPRPGLTAADLLTPAESRRVMLALGPGAEASATLLPRALQTVAEAPSSSSSSGALHHTASGAAASPSGAPQPAAPAPASVADAAALASLRSVDKAYATRQREALAVLRGLVDSFAEHSIPDHDDGAGAGDDQDAGSLAGQGERDGDLALSPQAGGVSPEARQGHHNRSLHGAGGGRGYGGPGSVAGAGGAADDDVISLDIDLGTHALLMDSANPGDALLDSGILEGPLKRRAAKGASTTGVGRAAGAVGSPKSAAATAAAAAAAVAVAAADAAPKIAELPPELLLDALSSEKRAGTLLAAHLARTGQRPVQDQYVNAQAEKARGSGAAARMAAAKAQNSSRSGVGAAGGSHSSATVKANQSTPAAGPGSTSSGSGSAARLARLMRGAPLQSTARLQYTPDGDLDVAPSTFLLERLGHAATRLGSKSRSNPASAPPSAPASPNPVHGTYRTPELPHRHRDSYSGLPSSGDGAKTVAASAAASAVSGSASASSAQGTPLSTAAARLSPLELPTNRSAVSSPGAASASASTAPSGSGPGGAATIPALQLALTPKLHLSMLGDSRMGDYSSGKIVELEGALRVEDSISSMGGASSSLDGSAAHMGQQGMLQELGLGLALRSSTARLENKASASSSNLLSAKASSSDLLRSSRATARQLTSTPSARRLLPALNTAAVCSTARGGTTDADDAAKAITARRLQVLRESSRLAAARAGPTMMPLDLTLAQAAALSSSQLATVGGANKHDITSPVAAQTSRRKGVLGAGISVALVQTLVTARPGLWTDSSVGADKCGLVIPEERFEAEDD